MLKIEKENNNTRIIIGSSDTSIPSKFSQGEKQPILIINNDVKEYYYKGFENKNDLRSFVIEDLELYDISSLYSTFRENAMFYIKKIANALKVFNYKDLDFCIIELFRIFFTKDGTVVILPQDLGYIIAMHLDDKTRIENSSVLYNSNFIKSYSIQGFLSQLVYFSILGFFPYSLKTVSENNNNIRKVSFYIDSFDKDLDLLLYKDLSPSLSYQRKMCKSNFLSDNIDSWLTRYSTFEIPKEHKGELNQKKLKELESLEKKTNRKIFLREKGGIIGIITFITVIVLSLSSWLIYVNVRPPYTKGFSQVQIINEYYDSQNTLNYDHLTASLAKNVKSPVSDEVLNLYVTFKTRQAYEHINTVFSPQEYFSRKDKTLPQGSFIYGVDDLMIDKTGDNTYIVSYFSYRPKPVETSSTELPSFVTIDKYKCKDLIKFENKGSYYLISEIKVLEFKKISEMEIKYEKTQHFR